MKDGRTHLAHKAEHAVDMETDRLSRWQVPMSATPRRSSRPPSPLVEQVEDAQANVDDRSLWKRSSVIRGITAIRRCDLDAGGIRSYVSAAGQGAT